MICLGLILIDEKEFRVPLLIVASRSTKTFQITGCFHGLHLLNVI